MKAFLRNFGLSLASFALLLYAGTVLFMTACLAIGYLPYSDRPGPGWGHDLLHWVEVAGFLGWGVYLLLGSLYTAPCLFVFGQFLSVWRCPAAVRNILLGLCAGIAAMFLVASMGWIIAVAPAPVYAAGVIGFAYGAAVLPRFLLRSTREHPASTSAKAIYSGIVLAAFAWSAGAWLLRPFNQDLELRILTPGARVAGLEVRPGKDSGEDRLLDSLGVGAGYHTAYQFMRTKGGAAHSRITLVVSDSLAGEIAVPQLKAVDGAYLLSGGGWRRAPATLPELKQKIRIRPESGGGYSVRIEPDKDWRRLNDPDWNSPGAVPVNPGAADAVPGGAPTP